VPRLDRPALVHAGLAALAVALVVKAAEVQLVHAGDWRKRAARQQISDAALPAPRGTIVDATGRVLVESRQLVRLRVAPREVRDRARLARLLAAAHVPKEFVRRATDSTRRWVELPGEHLPSDVAAATAMRGVHAQPVMQRVVSASPAIRRIVGRVGDDGRPLDGVELAMDTVLRGVRGTSVLLRDGRGGRLESPSVQGTAATPGSTVRLTLNWSLQDISERALADAVTRMRASGGDIVVLDPHRGEVLALASQRSDPRATAATAIAEPFEPGSTIKPFVAAALLARGRTRPDEVVNTEWGQWTVNGRTINDVHKAASMSLREVIRESSNIGIVKLAQRLRPREQFELLRDLGFGAPTGVPYPAEAGGTLRPPARWTAQSPASLAMGYEMAVTPLQLAVAYAAIANGGTLLEPALVKEIRGADGTVRYRHEAREVRRVFPEKAAAQMREMLRSVVDSGTATDADLASFALGGKSGTVRRTERGVGYAAGHYNAVFAGIFPIDDPQYVIIVKIDNPEGVYYGGKTAAPVSKVVLQAALAARDAALDRASLAANVRPGARDAYSPKPESAATLAARAKLAAAAPLPAALPAELRRDPADRAGDDAVAHGAVHTVVQLPARAPRALPPAAPLAVPVVQGLPVRDAVFALHRAGFRVRLADAAAGHAASRTQPGAGAVVRPGTLVTLYRQP
jgi:cell division protein FtsI (penicillin-binding protein 3)